MMKRISIFATVIAINFIYLTPRASASWLGDALGAVSNIGAIANSAIVSLVVYLVNIVIGTIANIFIYLAINLVNWSIEMNSTLANGSSFANFGWGITLNIAYFLLVIGIIIIAFGTMLRQNWGLKFLPTLIIIALLINLSYFIATELIVIADNITKVFLNTADAPLEFTRLADFFTTGITGDINKIATSGKIPTDISAAIGTAGSSTATLASPFIAIAFSIIAILTLLAIAVTFFIRYIYLTILLILLPVALALSILPIKLAGGDSWQEWKDSFFKWLLFGPVMAFFIYLAFALLKYPPTATGSTTIGTKLGDYLSIIGILLGGLFMAKSFGVAGAGIVQAGVNFTMGRVQQWAQRRGKNASDRAEQLRKQGDFAKAKRAEFAASMFNGRFGMTFAAQKVKDVLPKTWGGKADDAAKPISISTKAKDENWSPMKVNENIKRLAKDPTNEDFKDLVTYALKEGVLENPKSYLTLNIKEDLNKFGREKVYENIEKAAVGTIESFKQMQASIDEGTKAMNGNTIDIESIKKAQASIDDAAKAIKENIFDKVKPDKNFEKNVGIANVYAGNDEVHKETVTKALLMASPEIIGATIKAVAAKDKDKFRTMFNKAYEEYGAKGKLDTRVAEKFSKAPGFKKLFD